MKPHSLSLFGVLFCFAVSVSLAGCGDPTYKWYQKMTVEVDTPDGVKVASSVVSVEVQVGTGLLAKHTAGSPVSWMLHGEAVTLDFGEGRYLFALLTGQTHRSQPGRNALYAFADMASYDPSSQPLPVDQVERTLRDRPALLSLDAYPLLVTFADINDPKTVKRVDPNELAATFGPGIALRSITLAITEGPVTEGRVADVFPYFWWPSEKRKAYSGGRNPIRVRMPDGTVKPLTELDFFRR